MAESRVRTSIMVAGQKCQKSTVTRSQRSSTGIFEAAVRSSLENHAGEWNASGEGVPKRWRLSAY
jgi:hypothetical protein